MCSGLIISLLLNLSMLTLILASSPAETLSDFKLHLRSKHLESHFLTVFSTLKIFFFLLGCNLPSERNYQNCWHLSSVLCWNSSSCPLHYRFYSGVPWWPVATPVRISLRPAVNMSGQHNTADLCGWWKTRKDQAKSNKLARVTHSTYMWLKAVCLIIIKQRASGCWPHGDYTLRIWLCACCGWCWSRLNRYLCCPAVVHDTTDFLSGWIPNKIKFDFADTDTIPILFSKA